MKKDNALERFFNSELVRIEPWGKNALRVRVSPDGRLSSENRALIEQETVNATVEIDGESASIVNGNAKAIIDKNGKITFFNQNGRKVLEEALRLQPLKTPARFFKPQLMGKYQLTVSFESDPCERIFGMGQYQQPFLNLKGCVLEMAHRNSQASVPFYISDLGYGFLWNIPAIGEASFGKNITKFKAESTSELDYLIIIDDTPADIERAYMSCVGRAPMMPEFALGFWQSKLRYRNQEELLNIARGYKERGVPLSVIVCDFFHWPHQGDFRFDYDYFPDPEKMTEELREMGTELMVSVWPTIEFGSENYREMLEKGYLIRNDRGPFNHTEFVHPSVFYDATNPGARKFVWDTVKKNYYDKGVRLFWLDEAEPEYMLYDFDNHRYYEGNCAEVGNIYPVRYAQGFYEGLKSVGEKEIISLVRCAWAGSAKYGALVWSGDIMPTFEALNDQVRAGLNMAIAGIPWWTTDIGGFDYGDPTDNDYRELTVRWFEYATFCPVLRLHGYRAPYIPADEGATGGGQCYTGGDNEIWSFGDEAYEIMKDHIFLRERLKPYISDLMKAAHEKGDPPMRPLFYDFPSDKRVWDIDTEYMLGKDLLVAPILELGARDRYVYLPLGESWIEVLTGNEYMGGTSVTADAPLDTIPLFIRKGSELKREIFIKEK
ncbi:MAG: family 31 glucosidase [Clostridia bacterium]|nr:family 31 glucosidase [Clostridia bacterium]MBO5416040.1 family 31 glucosidase [Clostridia bacterium]